MNILFYNPYLSTLGGGERYFFNLIKCINVNAKITIGCPNLPDLPVMKNMGFPLSFEINRMSDEDFTIESSKYDLAVAITNYLPLESKAKKSLLVVQFPFNTKSSWKKLVTRFKEEKD